MTITEAAQKWGYSANWIRELVKTGRIKATFRSDMPVPYWDIPEQERPARTSSALSGTIRPDAGKRKKVAAEPEESESADE